MSSAGASAVNARAREIHRRGSRQARYVQNGIHPNDPRVIPRVSEAGKRVLSQ